MQGLIVEVAVEVSEVFGRFRSLIICIQLRGPFALFLFYYGPIRFLFRYSFFLRFPLIFTLLILIKTSYFTFPFSIFLLLQLVWSYFWFAGARGVYKYSSLVTRVMG